MTCLQEILLRLAMAVRSMAKKDVAEVKSHLDAVFAHLGSHGADEAAPLEACLFEQKGGSDVGGNRETSAGAAGPGLPVH